MGGKLLSLRDRVRALMPAETPAAQLTYNRDLPQPCCLAGQ
jgi:hypothetical protein